MSRQIQGLQSTVFVQACFDIAVLSGAYSHRLCYLFPARAGLLWLFFSMVYSGTKTSSSSWCCSNLADVPQTARQGIDTQQDFSCFMLGYFCLITHTEVKKKTKKKKPTGQKWMPRDSSSQQTATGSGQTCMSAVVLHALGRSRRGVRSATIE